MWLVPSRRRVAKLRNFCNSAVSAKTSTPALILVDETDWAENASEYQAIEQYHFPTGADWKFHVTKAVGMGPKVREVWPLIKDRAWVGILNDDHYIVTAEWDTKLINQLTGHNFITCNDRWNAPKRAAGATIFSMQLMEAFGFPMFPPGIDHLGIDDVFETIGRNCGCWEVDMKVVVEHHHAFKNPDMMDDTHRAIYGTEPWQNPQTGELSPEATATQKAFQEWITKDAPGVVTRVRQLRQSQAIIELPDDETKAPPVPATGG